MKTFLLLIAMAVVGCTSPTDTAPAIGQYDTYVRVRVSCPSNVRFNRGAWKPTQAGLYATYHVARQEPPRQWSQVQVRVEVAKGDTWVMDTTVAELGRVVTLSASCR